MNFIRLCPIFLSSIMLAAHFMRSEFPILILLSLLFPFLLFIKRSWAARTIQILLVLGSIEWIRTTVFYVKQRQAAGESWINLVFILGSVALVTLLSALVFKLPALKKRYSL